MKKSRFMFHLIIVICSFLLSISVNGSFAAVAPEYNWTIGGQDSKESELYRSVFVFKDLVEKYSNGRIKIKNVFGLGEICSEKTCIDQLGMKAIEIVWISDGNYGGFSNSLRVLELPYIFDSLQVAEKVITGPFHDRAREIIEKQDKRKLLYIAPGGMARDLWSNVSLKVPSDLKKGNMKLRSVFSPVENETIKIWGAAATPVPWGEVYTALESKLVNGLLMQAVQVEGLKFHEVCRYCNEIGYKVTQFLCLFMNLEHWNTLPDEIKSTILRASKESQKWAFEVSAGIRKESIEKMRKGGVTFYTPTRDEMELWRSPAIQIWKRFKPELNKDLLDLILKEQNKKFPD